MPSSRPFVATAAMTVGLTLYAWQTRVDLTAMGGSMPCLLIGLLFFRCWMAAYPSQAARTRTSYAAVAAAVFALFIVYDTQLILGGAHAHASRTDECVIASLSVYIDVVQLALRAAAALWAAERKLTAVSSADSRKVEEDPWLLRECTMFFLLLSAYRHWTSL